MKWSGLVLSIGGGGLISFEGVRFALFRIARELSSDPALLPRDATSPGQVPPLLLGALFYGTMLAGVALGQLFQHVTIKPNQQVRIRELLKALNTGRSWAAILASPVVFFATVPSLLALGAVSVSFFYALQSGFFCLAAFSAISAKFTQATPD